MSEQEHNAGALADEMCGIIRGITMSVNGKEEPAFLDDAVKAAIRKARRDERNRIIGWLSDDDMEKVITVRQVIDVIRAMPKEARDE